VPNSEDITQLAKDLHEAGLINLDKPMREFLSVPGMDVKTGDATPQWAAVAGSTYVLVRPN
jgi:hypothetical protein